jgi:hypothetical protein
MTRSCEEFELDLVMREHGALVPAAAGALDDHMAGCPACRRFAADGSDVEDALRRIAARDAERIDWERVHAGVRSLRRGQRLKLYLAPLFLLQVPLVLLVGTGQLPTGEPLFLVGPPVTVALYLGWIWLVGRPFREVLAVVQAEDELLVAYERELRRRRSRARVFAALNTIFAATGVALAVANPHKALAGVFVAIVFAAWAALDLLRTLPHIRRALAEVRGS